MSAIALVPLAGLSRATVLYRLPGNNDDLAILIDLDTRDLDARLARCL
jgi:hypothetical protein